MKMKKTVSVLLWLAIMAGAWAQDKCAAAAGQFCSSSRRRMIRKERRLRLPSARTTRPWW